MKYVFLAAWVKDHASMSAQIESIRLGEDYLCLCLKKAGYLIVVLSARDSFIYHSTEPLGQEDAPEMWTQLRNAQLGGIGIHPADRIIELTAQLTDIYGEHKSYTIVCELMPPKPNVIWCKSEGMVVIDALQKYSLAENPMRMVLSNQPYFVPKTSFTPESTQELLIPPVEGQQAEDVNSFFALKHKLSLQGSEHDDQLRHKAKLLARELKKVQKRLAMQEQDLQSAEKAEYYHACAEAIKPNMGSIKPGQTELTTTDYLSPEMAQISVSLQPDKSPLQNLNYYIKKYQKAKNGLSIIKINIQKTLAEIEAIQALISRVDAGEDLDLDYRDSTRVMSQKVQQLDKILNLRLSEDWHIYIGRKARENDYITTKLGKAQDWWFHSRIYRGAHVLLRNYKKKEVTADLIRICCSLAAWYSQAKFSVNVPVDYTQIRYVRKPRGSAAGFVTYTNYRTFFATPQDLRSVRSELKQ